MHVALIYGSFGLGLRVEEIASLTLSDVADKNYQVQGMMLQQTRCGRGE